MEMVLPATSWKRVFYPLSLLLSSFLVLTILSGCGSTQETTTDGVFGSGPKIQTLNPGNMVVSDNGKLAIGAPEKALDRSVNVQIRSITEPSEEIPIPDEATPAGDYYRISANENVNLSVDYPLGLMFEIPENADPSKLALGIRTDAGIEHQKPTPPSRSKLWSVVPGVYDLQEEVMVFRLNFLSR